MLEPPSAPGYGRVLEPPSAPGYGRVLEPPSAPGYGRVLEPPSAPGYGRVHDEEQLHRDRGRAAVLAVLVVGCAVLRNASHRCITLFCTVLCCAAILAPPSPLDAAGDRGGVADLIQTIKVSRLPIICICNDKYSQKLRSLRNHVSAHGGKLSTQRLLHQSILPAPTLPSVPHRETATALHHHIAVQCSKVQCSVCISTASLPTVHVIDCPLPHPTCLSVWRPAPPRCNTPCNTMRRSVWSWTFASPRHSRLVPACRQCAVWRASPSMRPLYAH